MLIAFTKDWDDVPTSTTHVLRRLARSMPVLWIESIGTRRPDWRSGRDLGRVVRRLRRALQGPRRKENQLWVAAPLLIPRAENLRAVSWNRRILGGVVRRWAAGVRGGPMEYWCFVPNAVDLLPAGAGRGDEVEGGTWNVEGRGEERARSPTSDVQPFTFHGQGPEVGHYPASSSAPRPLVIYYCVDDWGQFENLDGAWLDRRERALLDRADAVFAASRFLAEKCGRVAGKRVHHMPHGVDHARFAAALDAGMPVAAELAGLPRPIAGFYGNLSSWVDFGLIEALAGRLPGWTFVLVGPAYRDTARLRRFPNIRLLGRRAYEALPGLCRGFDVGIIPYDMRHPRMASVNPVKTLELLAAGVPVVSARIPELEQGFGPDVALCAGLDEWCAALERQAARQDRAAISARAKAHDWAGRIRAMREIVAESGGQPET